MSKVHLNFTDVILPRNFILQFLKLSGRSFSIIFRALLFGKHFTAIISRLQSFERLERYYIRQILVMF